MYLIKVKGNPFAGTKPGYGEGEIVGGSTPFSNVKLQI